MPKQPRADRRDEETVPSSDEGTWSDVGLAVPIAEEAVAPLPATPDLPPPSAPTPDQASARAQFTPDELAAMTGNVGVARDSIAFGEGARPKPRPAYSWQHAAAAQLHGWGLHEHHAGAPILLSQADYEAALKAAEAPVTLPADGNRQAITVYVPHAPALSPHAPKEG